MVANIEQIQIKSYDESSIVMHTVQNIVTLDIAMAAFIVDRMGQSPESFKSDDWEILIDYINEIESGISKPPFEKSLYAFYSGLEQIAISEYAKVDIPEAEKVNNVNEFILKKFWPVMASMLESNKLKESDSPYLFMNLIEKQYPKLKREIEEIISNELSRYEHDVARGESFEIELPLKNPSISTKFARVNLMCFEEPQSRLWKFFTRNVYEYPTGEKKSFPCTYVHNPQNSIEHVISVSPGLDYNLKGLTEVLEEVENEIRKQSPSLSPRGKDNPRDGGIYDYNDPWYDERHSNYSIIANPTEGTRLTRNDLQELIFFHFNPLKNIEVRNTTLSIYIPLWLKENFQISQYFQLYPMPKDASKEFFPYVNNLFMNCSNNLKCYRYKDTVNIKIDPQFLASQGTVTDIIRKKNQEKANAILNKSDVSMDFFQYEHGLAFIELIIDFKDISIMDSQWLEYLITLTPAAKLFGKMPNLNLFDERIKLLNPDKHFACTSMTGFHYNGNILSTGRSTGGALKMLYNDVEPLFRNLPNSVELVNDQTVIDEIKKRCFFASGTSLLNYDDSGDNMEHSLSHNIARVLFNMILAQKFILSKSREDIADAEREYLEFKNNITFGKWIRSWFVKKSKFSSEPKAISNLRENILHLVSSSRFNVISNNKIIQNLLNVLRKEMNIETLYSEVKDRCEDLDEFLAKKESETQSRVFAIFTFIFSPLSFVAGLTSGFQFTSNPENPFPFVKYKGISGWETFSIYLMVFGIVFGVVWVLYKWKSIKRNRLNKKIKN